jgi:copper resistance protein C
MNLAGPRPLALTTSLLVAGFFVAGEPASGQQPGHAHSLFAADTTGISKETETTPLDNSVMDLAPGKLALNFPRNVRLVKLTLRNNQRDWVDINFRYNPRARNSFSLELPALSAATYYTADWAILSANEQLVRGSFSFSFGPEAVPPSETRDAEELVLMMRNGGPDTQFVTPPRTNIILDQDPPRYDPPFTIELKDEDQQ